jgi:hypothetical protein
MFKKPTCALEVMYSFTKFALVWTVEIMPSFSLHMKLDCVWSVKIMPIFYIHMILDWLRSVETISIRPYSFFSCYDRIFAISPFRKKLSVFLKMLTLWYNFCKKNYQYFEQNGEHISKIITSVPDTKSHAFWLGWQRGRSQCPTWRRKEKTLESNYLTIM